MKWTSISNVTDGSHSLGAGTYFTILLIGRHSLASKSLEKNERKTKKVKLTINSELKGGT